MGREQEVVSPHSGGEELKRNPVRVSLLSNLFHAHPGQIHTAAEQLGFTYLNGAELSLAPQELNMLRDYLREQEIQSSRFSGIIDGQQDVCPRPGKIVELKPKSHAVLSAPRVLRDPQDPDPHSGEVVIFHKPIFSSSQRRKSSQTREVSKPMPVIPEGYVSSVEASDIIGCKRDQLKGVRVRYGITAIRIGLSFYYRAQDLILNKDLYAQELSSARLEKERKKEKNTVKSSIPEGYVGSVEAAQAIGCYINQLKAIRTRFNLERVQIGRSFFYEPKDLLRVKDELETERRNEKGQAPEGFITENEAKKILGVGSVVLIRTVNAFNVSSVRVGNKIYFSESSLLAVKEEAARAKEEAKKRTEIIVPDGFINKRMACEILGISSMTFIKVREVFKIREFGEKGQKKYFSQEDLIHVKQERDAQKLENKHQRLIRKSQITKPEGYLSGREVRFKLGISYDRWVSIRDKVDVRALTIGRYTFYDASDIEALIGKLPPVRIRTKELGTRIEQTGKRNRSEKSRAQSTGDNQGINVDVRIDTSESENLSALSLHFRDVSRYPIPSFEKQRLLGAKILSAKLALVAINTLLTSGHVNEQQIKQLEELRNQPAIKFISSVFQGEIESEMQNGLEKSALLQLLERLRTKLKSDIEKAKNDPDETKLPALITNLVNRYSSSVVKGKASFDELVLSNLRLGIHFAKKMATANMSMEELTSHAYEGLMIAAAKYDARRGFRFSSYASRWVIQRISRGRDDTGALIRLPVHVQAHLRATGKEDLKVLQTTGNKPDRKLTPQIIAALKTINVASLDAPIREDSDATLQTFTPDGAEGIHKEMERQELHTLVRSSLSEVLTSPERRIAELLFGFDQPAMTLDQVGKVFGLTGERIRQIKLRILKKLRDDASIVALMDFIK